jgi:hypothetical protein
VLQAVLQHVPSTQLPLAHWLPLVQGRPMPIGPHELFEQVLLPEQCELSVPLQLIQHCVASWHLYGAQLPFPLGTQVPAPLHVEGAVKFPVATSQVPAAQTVPCGHFRQLPAPSQVPSFAHVEAACPLQVRLPIGIAPAPTTEQMPMRPVRLQAWQAPPHGELQQ